MSLRLGLRVGSLALLVFSVLGLGIAVAASTLASKAAKSTAQAKDDSVTVTGCLQDVDGDHLFQITGAKGDNYVARSKVVLLKDHVGQKVTLTGTIKDDDDEDLNEEFREAGDRLLIVSSLKVINPKCK